jgi:hypothetical protein
MKRWIAATYEMPVETWARVMEMVAAAKNQESGFNPDP